MGKTTGGTRRGHAVATPAAEPLTASTGRATNIAGAAAAPSTSSTLAPVVSATVNRPIAARGTTRTQDVRCSSTSARHARCSGLR